MFWYSLCVGSCQASHLYKPSANPILAGYGDHLLQGITGDAASAWFELDTDGDGKVSFAEFERGMHSRLGSLCPNSSTLRKTYDSIQKVKGDFQAGRYNIDDLKRAIDRSL